MPALGCWIPQSRARSSTGAWCNDGGVLNRALCCPERALLCRNRQTLPGTDSQEAEQLAHRATVIPLPKQGAELCALHSAHFVFCFLELLHPQLELELLGCPGLLLAHHAASSRELQ